MSKLPLPYLAVGMGRGAQVRDRLGTSLEFYMYENATTLRLHAGTLDLALEVIREQILPILKSQKGLIHIALVPDRINDRLTVISLWASAYEAAEVEKTCLYLRALANLDPFVVVSPNPPGEVVKPQRWLAPKILLN